MKAGRALLLIALAFPLPGCAREARPNILLIVVDTARADRFSTNGYARETTPVAEALGRDGAVYLDASTPSPWTLPAHASLFTGLYPSSHGAESGHLVLDAGLPILARDLKESGYRTQAYIENPWVGKDYNFHVGFDTFDEVWRHVRGTEGDMGAAAVSDKIERWLAWRDGNAEARAQPFFIFINYFEPHLPYNAPEPERARFLSPGADREAVDRLRRFKNPGDVKLLLGLVSLTAADMEILSALYDGEIAYVDRRIGEVIGSLARRGLLDATVVVVTSDHGEMLGEHGLVDHKLSLYEPVLRIPLVLRYPPAVPAGQRLDAPVMLQDLRPTLLALAGAGGAGAARGAAWPPESRLLPGIRGLVPGAARGLEAGDPVIAEYARPVEFLQVMRNLAPDVDPARWDGTLVAFRVGGRKLIWSSLGRSELYDLRADPDERLDLFPQGTAPARPDPSAIEAWLRRDGVSALFRRVDTPPTGGASIPPPE